eukprot:m.8493 g.8493  ORF g.8493 m.8493 type:complete len:242 (+) comp20630_c0_seq1:82-807(+)
MADSKKASRDEKSLKVSKPTSRLPEKTESEKPAASGRKKTKSKPKEKRKTETNSDKKSKEKTSTQTSLFSFFPVAKTRSQGRLPDHKELQQKRNEERLRDECEEGIEVRETQDKGRSVFAVRSFKAGDLICEYSGDLISKEEAEKREDKYAGDSTCGCYMYYFKWKGKCWCLDATKDNGRKGRLLNHAKLKPNVNTKLLEVDGRLCLSLIAKRNIKEDEELLYDYGERAKKAVESFPWLTT